MPTLAVAMIVKNEAADLAACLESVTGWVDEIVILDSGSTDATAEIARRYGAAFYVNDQWPGFGPQRRLAQQHVRSDYVLWLDADERISEPLKASIQAAVAADRPNTLYAMPRLSSAFGQTIRHSGWYPDYVTRLYRTRDTAYSEALVHESVLVPEGFAVEKLNGDLRHDTYKNLHQYLMKSAHYAKAWADQKQQAGKKSSLGAALLHGAGCFLRMYVLRAGFLDGRHGLLLAVLYAHATFAKYADLWLRQQQGR